MASSEKTAAVLPGVMSEEEAKEFRRLHPNDQRSQQYLTQAEKDEFMAQMRSDPTWAGTPGSDIRDMLGNGRVEPSLQNQYTHPEQAYDMYKDYDINEYLVNTEPYDVRNYATNRNAMAWAGSPLDQAYDQQLAVNKTQQELKDAAYNARSNAMTYQGRMSGATDMAMRTQADPVRAYQTLQGQDSYQAYLDQMASAQQGAAYQQQQADMFGAQYRDPSTTAAMMAHRQATNESLAANLALARSGTGNAGASMARALTANAGAEQTAAAQAAQLQAQQEAALRQSWLQAQGAAQQSYAGLGQTSAQVANMGAQDYLAAQKLNADIAQQKRDAYLKGASMYGSAGQLGLEGSKAYMGGLNQYTANAEASRNYGLEMAKWNQQSKLAAQQAQYAEWVRQENVRQGFGTARYNTMTGAQAANAAATERAQMYNEQSRAKGTGVLVSTGASLTSAGIGALSGASNAAGKAAQNTSTGNTGYDPDNDYNDADY